MSFITEYQFNILIILGLITLALSIYLGMLFVRLRSQLKISKQKEKDYQNQLAEKELFYRDSIITICKATLQQQCELSEACLRIHHLIQYYPEKASHADYQVFSKMHEEISDFAVLDARKQLTKQEMHSQDKARFKIEDRYRTEIYNALKILKDDFQSIN